MMVDNTVLWGLLLSTLAGGSTVIGGIIGIIKRPSDGLLAFLLGTAIGVMLLLSVVEMWIHNALEHGWGMVTIASGLGLLLYRIVQPLLPDADPETLMKGDGVGSKSKGSQQQQGTVATRTSSDSGPVKDPDARAKISSVRSAELLRLGLLMSLTMTLHNLPEGFAVAFSSMTDFGPIMALAIAIHNIPEGVIVAAPVYAATGSRWKSLLIAALSGLSEPVGALIALLSVKPIISEKSLHITLAFVGGIMSSVCLLELWPEGRKCKSDGRLFLGIAFGAVIMGWTLAVGI